MKKGVGPKQIFLRLSVALITIISLLASSTIPAIEARAVADGGGMSGGGTDYSYAGMTLDERAASYALYYGVVKCLTGINEISNDDVLNNSIDGANNSYLWSYVIDPTDGISQCNTTLSRAVGLWGYGTLSSALQAWGYTPPAGSSNDWTAPRPGETSSRAILDRIYGTGINRPTLGDPEAYIYWSKTLVSACKISNPVEYATADSAQKAAVDRTGQMAYVKVAEPKPDLTGTTMMIYTFGGDSWNINNAVPVNSPLYKASNYSCQAIADMVSTAAPGYITYARANGLTVGGVLASGTDPQGESKTTCAIDGVGWIICPVMTFLAKINDQAFGFISKNFLEFKTTSLTDTSSPLYQAWAAFRNIANVAFVIAFLIIIYSQLTSAGISNYGIKRMIPRLIIAAVLVNTSYYVCIAAVELSNVLGYGVKSLFDSIGGTVPNLESGDATWERVVSTILVAGFAAAAIALALSGPLLLAALLALMMTAFILLARQALIILLIVIAPLAFVAYLLPNTEQWYKKWQKAFMTVLVVFPVVGAIFGASTLASNIIKAGKQPDENTALILALGLLAIPLFAVPTVLKGSLSAAGAIGAKLQGLSDKTNGNIGKRIGDSSRLGAYRDARKRNQQIKRAQITGGVYQGKNPLARASSRFSRTLNSSRLTGNTGTKVAQQAAQLAQNLEVENVKAAAAQIDQANINGADLRRVAMGDKAGGLNGGDASMRAAAAAELADRGDYGGLADAWDSVRNSGDSQSMRVFANTLSRTSNKPAYIGAGALQLMREGNADSHDEVAVSGVNSGAYSPEKLASSSRQELDYVGRLIDHGETDRRGNMVNIAVLQGAANTAISNPEINKAIGKNRDKIAAFNVGTYDALDVDSSGHYSSAHRDGD